MRKRVTITSLLFFGELVSDETVAAPVTLLCHGRHRRFLVKTRILIVDDDPELRQALKLLLRANHYDTVHAVGFPRLALA